jgi:hypothetical protein
MKRLLFGLLFMLSTFSYTAQGSEWYRVKKTAGLTENGGTRAASSALKKMMKTTLFAVGAISTWEMWLDLHDGNANNAYKYTRIHIEKYIEYKNNRYCYSGYTLSMFGDREISYYIYSSEKIGALVEGNTPETLNMRIIWTTHGDTQEGIELELEKSEPYTTHLGVERGNKLITVREREAIEEQERQEKELQQRKKEQARREQEMREAEEKRILEQKKADELRMIEDELAKEVCSYAVLKKSYEYYRVTVGLNPDRPYRYVLDNKKFKKALRRSSFKGDFSVDFVLQRETGKLVAATVVGNFTDKEKNKLVEALKEYEYESHKGYNENAKQWQKIDVKVEDKPTSSYHNSSVKIADIAKKIQFSMKFLYNKDENPPLKYYSY